MLHRWTHAYPWKAIAHLFLGLWVLHRSAAQQHSSQAIKALHLLTKAQELLERSPDNGEKDELAIAILIARAEAHLQLASSVSSIPALSLYSSEKMKCPLWM